MVSRVSSITRKEQEAGAGELVTTGTKPGAIPNHCDDKPHFPVSSQPQCSYMQWNEGKVRYPGGQGLPWLGSPTAVFVGRDGMMQGCLGSDLQMACVPLASARCVAPPTCRGGRNGTWQRGHEFGGQVASWRWSRVISLKRWDFRGVRGPGSASLRAAPSLE